MEWTLDSMVSFNGRAYRITAIVKDTERRKIYYTLNQVDRQYTYLTVTRLY